MRYTNSSVSALAAAAAFAALLCSCEPKPVPVPVEVPGVSAALTVSDGVVSRSGVTLAPKVTVTLSGGDPLANYTVFYAAGSSSETVRGVWTGVEQDLSGAFADMTQYGSRSLVGKVFNETDPTDTCSFAGEVWMRGMPVLCGSMFIEKDGERSELQPGRVTIGRGQTGRFVYAFQPADAMFVMSVRDNGRMLFEEPVYSSDLGEAYVDWKSAVSGSDSVVVCIENGPDRNEFVQRFDISEKNVDYGFDFSLDFEPSISIGNNLPVRILFGDANADAEYDVTYSFDGVQEATALSGVNFLSPRSFVLPVSGLSEGSYSFTVTVTRSDYMSSKSVSGTFIITYVALAGVSASVDGTPLSEGSALWLDASQNTYRLRFSSIPADATVNSYSYPEIVGFASFALSGSWPEFILNPVSVGESYINMTITDAAGKTVGGSWPVTVYRRAEGLNAYLDGVFLSEQAPYTEKVPVGLHTLRLEFTPEDTWPAEVTQLYFENGSFHIYNKTTFPSYTVSRVTDGDDVLVVEWQDRSGVKTSRFEFKKNNGGSSVK